MTILVNNNCNKPRATGFSAKKPGIGQLPKAADSEDAQQIVVPAVRKAGRSGKKRG